MKKRFFSLVMAAAMLLGLCAAGLTAAEAETPFVDAAKNQWFYSYVKYVYENGIMDGIEKDKFAPDDNMTRAMFVTILGRLDGAEKKETNTFSDVVNGSWYSGYVGWAAEKGIFDGYPDGSFKPDDKITRQEAATAMTRYVNYVNAHLLKVADASKNFEDKDNIAEWAAANVETMRQSGILKGNDAGDFLPESNITRAEAAAIIQRVRDMILYLRLEESITPSYEVEGKEFCFMNAYQLYYSGPALTTSYNGSKVVGENIPRLVEDENGRKITHFYDNPANTIADGNYFGLDLKIACIDPEKYPFVRIGYTTSDGSDVKLGVYSGDTSKPAVDAANGEDPGAGRVLTADLSSSDAWGDGSEQIVLTVMANENADLALNYIAMFKTAEAAAAFSVSDNGDLFGDYNGTPISYKKIDDKTLSDYMKLIDDKKEEILNNSDDIDPKSIKGKCYYISSISGDDDNDGLSPETPWKSLSKLYNVKPNGILTNVVKEGDAVLFERGSKFYRWYPYEGSTSWLLDFAKGASYGAYGDGKKPIFTTSFEFDDGSSTGKWSKVEGTDCVYALDQTFYKPEGARYNYNDIASIAINGGSRWGVKVIIGNDESPIGKTTTKCGMVYNGKYTYYEGGIVFEGPQSLKNDLEYWIDYNTNKLYLCSVDGNPGEIFDEIMITRCGSAISGSAENVVADNLAIIGAGTHGIDIDDATNFLIKNCQFEWIGGAEMGGRLGNAIQNWGGCDGFFAIDNYFNEVYDTGFTTQGGGSMKNIEFYGNVLDRCNMSTEFFNHNDHNEDPAKFYSENIIVRDNYQRYAGYSFGHTRPVGNKTGTFMLGAKNWDTPAYNLVIENNINLYATYFAAGCSGLARGEHAEGVIFRNNVYLMNPERGYAARSRNNFMEQTGSNKTLFPYTEQYVQYLADMGVDRGSTYYYYDGYLFDCEADGAYYDD